MHSAGFTSPKTRKPQKGARIFAQDPGDSQVSRYCDEKKHRGLAVLVGLIVKLSP